MSKTYNGELQQKLRDYMREEKVSQSKLSMMLDISTTQLSQYLNSQYPGDTDATERKIDEFLQTQNARAEALQQAAPFTVNTGYVPTTVSEDVYQSILFAQLNRCMSVLHGDAGVGKTKGAIKFAKDHPNSAVYIRVSPTNASLTGVVALLARKLGITGMRGRRQLMDAVCTRLLGTNKVVIVDEAQFLNSTAIDALRTISDGDETSDNLGNGVCLIGNSKIQSKIKGSADAGFAQIFTRIHLQREYRTTQTTRGDIAALFPQLDSDKNAKELDFLYSVSRSIHSIRDAVYIFDLAVKAQDIGFDNLRSIAVHMGVGMV